jgi:phage tail sheath protein FI
MPVQVSYPGLYVQEIPSSAQTVTGVSTSATAFVDFFPAGPVGQAVQCSSWNDFQRTFGGLDARSDASYAIYQYFLNGGQTAWVIRLADATAGTAAPAGALAVTAPAAGMLPASNQPITVQWTPSGSLTGASPTYTLLLSTDGGQSFQTIPPAPAPGAPVPPFQLTGTPTATSSSFQFNAAPTSTTPMVVRVAATDASGNLLASGDSGTVTLVPAALTITAPAKGAVVNLPGELPLTVSWNTPPPTAVTQSVLLSTDNGNTFQAVKTSPPALNGTATTCTIPQLSTPAKPQQAVLQVVARDVTGAVVGLGTSAAFTLQVQPLDVTGPTAAVAVPLTAPLAVSWTVPTTTPPLSPQGFAVLLSTDGGNTFQPAATTPATLAGSATSCTIAQIPTPPAVQNAVIQVVAQGAGGATIAANNSKPFPLQPPALTVTAPPATAVSLPLTAPLPVNWQALATAPAQYAILLSTDGGNTFQQVATAPGTATTASITQIPTPTGTSPQNGVVAVAAQDAKGVNLAAGNSAAFPLQWTAQPASQGPTFTLAAASPGAWGNSLVATLAPAPAIGTGPAPKGVFNLTVQLLAGKQVVASESYQNLTISDPKSTQYAPTVVAASSLVVLAPQAAGATGFALPAPASPSTVIFGGGSDGSVASPVDAATLLGNAFASGNPLAPLDSIAPQVFNLLCLPTLANASDGMIQSVFAQAVSFCSARQAFFLFDIPPTLQTVDQMYAWAAQGSTPYTSAENYSAAVYFPRLLIPDPLNGYRPKNVAASGTMAGVYAASDAAVGVWKAPAGTTAVLQGATPAIQVTDAENGQLNPVGVNVLRTFPIYGSISWGARTLAGADQIDSEWKYIPVRRLVDYIEMSLVQSLKWAVFQPNDQTLWANLSQEVSTFLQGLYNQGALFGDTPAQAYFVTCDATTTTPTDIAQGIVNILIGVAPVNPAEFVILQIQQIAGQTS